MGGHQVTAQGPNDDGFDEDGYDESQRAEILEATGDGPSDGTILTDLNPDLGREPLEDDDDDEIDMLSDETAEEDDSVDPDEDDIDEDDAQVDFEDDAEDAGEVRSDGDDVAVNP
ncbi:MAG: DNA primase [Pseudomonadota bacterium]